MKDKPRTPPDIKKLIKKMVKESQGDVYAVFESLREILAGIPADMGNTVIYGICSEDIGYSGSLATYWLLAQDESARERAATALLHQARLGKQDGALVRRLPMVRNWIPAGTARAIVDEVIREQRLRGIEPETSPVPAKLREIQATIPDGVGCQSIALVAKRKIGMILTKHGYGVKDAYVIPCRAVREVQQILGHMHELGGGAVDLDTVKVTVSAALADGHRNGYPPAHGLVDVVSEFGLEDIRSNGMSAQEWLAFLDPENAIAGMSPQKRGRLINRSDEVLIDLPMIDSWFEDDEDVRDLLAGIRNPRSRIKRLKEHFETRREYWAIQTLKAASILKAAGADWTSLAVAAWALLDGRALEKIPLMEYVIDSTIEAFESNHGGDVPLETDFLGDGGLPLHEGRDVVNPIWLDGFLVSVVIAPKSIPPQQWLNALLEVIAVAYDEEEILPLVNGLMSRYQQIGIALDEGEMPLDVRSLPADELAGWAEGFMFGNEALGDAWKARSMTRSDNKILDVIAGVAKKEELGFDPMQIIESWVFARFEKRR